MKPGGSATNGVAVIGNRISSSGLLTPASGLARTTLPFQGVLTAAGTPGSTVTVPIAGTSFYVYSATGPITIQPNGGSAIDYVQGTGLGPSNIPFVSLQISNPGSAPVTFELVVGFTELIDKRLILVAGNLTTSLPVRCATTLCKGYGLTPIGSGARVPFPGTGIAGLQRKQFLVYNTDASNGIYIEDSGNNVLGAVGPAQSWTIETSDDVSLFNPNGGSVTVIPGETYYNE